MSTANISQEIKQKFPLHSAVWENDYRQLEEEIREPQVGKTSSNSLHRSVDTKQTFFCSTESVGRRQISSTHRVEVGQPCWQMLHSDPPFNATVSNTDLFILWRNNTITHKKRSLGLLQTDWCYVSGCSYDFLRTCVEFVRPGLIDRIRYSHFCASYVYACFHFVCVKLILFIFWTTIFYIVLW